MSYRARVIRKALKNKGFAEVETHHHMYFLEVDGKRTGVHTYVSHSVREYGDSLLGQMARQMRLKRTELEDFIECDLSGEAYVDKLRESGHIKTD